ncbi:PSD1 and planctomycete cytochrome C domain-containing protein [Tautonia plasticadhaerens]|uniref:Planctomycete cytochrome C n=1 Tax=Tautonia plasticadhaerens TaxID=2527974 RepID=A0A518H733_9BACT|nr:PSD1 and planctomycete cytochrome C domain-containing protein [Tautonia plasticadhaerens]QDV36689.1 Planctomycete cytochrome C [Tautonia plasticadhaerens]
MRPPNPATWTRSLTLAACCVIAVAACRAVRADDPPEPSPTVDFSRDIRPLLSDACFACHGPDEGTLKAGLRLDLKDDAFADRGGYAAVVPGDPEASELFYRISTEDEFDRMPPADSHKGLSPGQVELFRAWIEQGAPWEEHWAFVTPTKPEPPEVADESRVENPIDAFILDRLDREGPDPAPEADPEVLVRRAHLDLTGLPPTPEEVGAYLADDRPDRYEQLVDRLLDSPHYGEHMARFWLDAARYGDTHGLHLDNYREMWPYRDWVIEAFNRNLPYDRFVVEQLAGDLLPDPTPDQVIATGFNRAHVTTSEGGSIEEEVFVRNVVERVDATGTVFLGLTVACARCHDHKFDPISQADYYSMFAFFNSLDGKPLDGNAKAHPPVLQVPSEEHRAERQRLEAELASVREQIAEAVAAVDYDPSRDEDRAEYVRREDFVWVDDALPPGAKPSSEGEWAFVSEPEHPVFLGSKAHVRTSEGQSQHLFTEASQGLLVGEGDTLFAHAFLDPLNPPKEIMLQWNTGEWKHRAYWGENLIDYGTDGTTERVSRGALPTTGEWVRLEVPAADVGIPPGTTITGLAFTQHGGTVRWDAAGIRSWTPQLGESYASLASWIRDQRVLGDKAALPDPITQLVAVDPGERTGEQSERLRDYFVEHAYAPARPTLAPLLARRAEVEKAKTALEESIPTTLVWKEMAEPKPAFILNRGEYDQPGDPVGRSVPSFLPPLPEGAPVDRLGLASWLVDRSNPLTARVAANRLWQQVFGVGLVKTSEDFGAQGETPSHPELLDWLAVQFQDDGWDVKEFMRRLVTSNTYRRSSRATPELLARDPKNRLYARGPRFRLDAETIRDQALFVGGLLVEQVGGPSVKPPQPSGLWEAVGYTSSNTAQFRADTGREKVHRRSLYTFWKRTSPPPQMTTFDAPSRESCTMRRERTNTPLQALLLLNDPQYVEAARALAERTMREAGSSTEDRLTRMFRIVAARTPEADELAELTAAYDDLIASYRDDPEAARQLIAVGETTPDPAHDPAELAAWTVIANTLLNLDEVIVKG